MLALAEELGLDELRAQALSTLGVARFNAGDRGGLEDVARSLELALAINAPVQIYNAYNTLAALHWNLAPLARAVQLVASAREVAERFGLGHHARHSTAGEARIQLMLGHWPEAERLADEFFAKTERAVPHYNEPFCRYVRATIRLARGDAPGALDESVRSLELARRSRDPQILAPSIATRARILAATGSLDEAAVLADELLRMPDPLPGYGEPIDFAWVLLALGRGVELSALVERAAGLNGWVTPALAIAAGDLERAANLLAETGAATEEAYARLRAAEALAKAGRRAEADAQLQRALDFYREVGATAYVREAEALLAEPGGRRDPENLKHDGG